MASLRFSQANLALVLSLAEATLVWGQAAPRPTPTPQAPPASAPTRAVPRPKPGSGFDAAAKKAHAAREAGRIDEAILLYREALAARPAWAEGLWYAGTLLYEKDRFVEAREALRRLVALTPQAGPAWAMLGLTVFRLQEYKPALTHLEKGRELGLGSNETLIQVTRYHIAALLTRFKAFPNATDMLVGLARSQPETDDLCLALGLNILKWPLLPSEVSADDRPLVLQAGRAAYLQAVGRHDEARGAFERLRSEKGAAPGVAQTYRDYLIAYPKALSEPTVRDGAIQTLRVELEAAPRSFEANFYLALLLKEASPQEAIRCLEAARAARPQAPEPAYELGRLLFASGRTEEARELLEAAVNAEPGFAGAHVLLASIYYRLDRKADGDRARAAARKADESVARAEPDPLPTPPPPGRFTALAQQAAAAREGERLGEAVKAYREALALSPVWEEGLWYLGTILFDQESTVEAKDAFVRLVNLKPEGGAGWAYLGLCEFRLKDYAAALQHLERGRSLGLGDGEGLLNTARYYTAILLSRRGEFEAALQFLGAFAAAGNQSPSVLEALGVATLRLPRLPAEVSVEKRPVVAAVGRAAFYQSARRFPEARKAYEEALRLYPDEPNLHYAQGVFLLAEEPDQALAAFREEIARSPDHVFARLHLAFEYLKRSDPAAALPFAEQAARLDPQSFAARNALGRALLGQGDASRALIELEAGTKLAPDSPEMQFALARAYAQAGRPADADRARAEFRRLDEIRKSLRQGVSAPESRGPDRGPVPDPPG